MEYNMAEYCNECEKELFGINRNDEIKYISLKRDEVIPILCEGCGIYYWCDIHGVNQG
jgi:uncharacterized protein with PIN domain